MKTCVVIPGHNEQGYIAAVLRKVSTFTKDVIYVDDGSTDSSAQLALRQTRHVLIHAVNLGKGAAMKTGALYAFDNLHANAVIFLDADDQHDPAHIPEFAKALEKYDVVFGVRGVGTSMPLARYMGNKMASIFLNLLYGRYIDDIPSGYKAITKNAFEKIAWVSTGYEVETEIAVRTVQKQLSLTCIPIKAIYHDTDKGMTLLDALHICRCLVEWRIGI